MQMVSNAVGLGPQPLTVAIVGEFIPNDNSEAFRILINGLDGGADATPLETAVGDAVVSARLALIHAESEAESKGASVAASAMKAKRLDLAQNRLNSTLKLLAQVQRTRQQQAAPWSPRPPLHPVGKSATNAAQI